MGGEREGGRGVVYNSYKLITKHDVCHWMITERLNIKRDFSLFTNLAFRRLTLLK